MKKLLLSLCIVFLSLSAFAIPGVQDIIPTESGQFVYYRDNSFKSETYIGFLQYDKATYAIRYYAPSPDIGSSEIELLITIDPSLNYVLMTGEKIISPVTMDDNTTINYLHDLFYEFSSRRKKTHFSVTASTDLGKLQALANTLQNSTVQKTEDYFQYGGEVVIEYDFSIPLFNLRSIKSGNKILLEAVTMGQLMDNEDKSFTDFTGFPEIPKKSGNKNLQQNNIDSLWTENENSFWFIQDDALLYSYDIEMTQEFFTDQSYGIFDFLGRKLSLSIAPSYVYLPEQSVYEKDDSLIISNVIYLPQSSTFTKDTKIVTPPIENKGGVSLYSLTSISAFYEYYYANEDYFEKKIESFTK